MTDISNSDRKITSLWSQDCKGWLKKFFVLPNFLLSTFSDNFFLWNFILFFVNMWYIWNSSHNIFFSGGGSELFWTFHQYLVLRGSELFWTFHQYLVFEGVRAFSELSINIWFLRGSELFLNFPSIFGFWGGQMVFEPIVFWTSIFGFWIGGQSFLNLPSKFGFEGVKW